MAQKATKQLAAQNVASLRNLHLASFLVHTLRFFQRFILPRIFRSIRRSALIDTPYLVLGILPSIAIEIWFEITARPKYHSTIESFTDRPQAARAYGIKTAGADLNAKGLTEYAWDVLYWTWFCIVSASIFGNRAWWLWIAIPMYTIWSAWGLVRGLFGLSPLGSGLGLHSKGQQSSMNDGLGNPSASSSSSHPQSRRQQKAEKKGVERTVYR